MELFESKYWLIPIILQKFVGIWFFQARWKNYLSWVYVYFFTISFMIAMGVRLYNELGVDLGVVVENCVGEMYLNIVLSKLTISILIEKKLTKLLSEIAQDWKTRFVEEDEVNIMHQYTEYGRQSILLYSGYMITAVAIFLTFPISSVFLDIIIPLENGTRPRNLPYYAEYGIDIEENYYPLLGQAVFGGIGTVVVLVSFDLGFILIVQHVVGLFALVTYRLEKVKQVAEEIENGVISLDKGDYLAYRHTTIAVEYHKTVLEYVNRVEDCYNLGWLFILFQNMIMLGGGLFTLMLKLDYPSEILRYLAVMAAILIHFYYIFLPGQKIIDSSEGVFETVYACKWYNLSQKTKTLIKIMLLRTLKNSELTGGKFFPLSMETYCNMMKTGLSIFTVFNS